MRAETRHTRFWLCGRCCHLLHMDESGYGICEKTGRKKRCSESCDCGKGCLAKHLHTAEHVFAYC